MSTYLESSGQHVIMRVALPTKLGKSSCLENQKKKKGEKKGNKHIRCTTTKKKREKKHEKDEKIKKGNIRAIGFPKEDYAVRK